MLPPAARVLSRLTAARHAYSIAAIMLDGFAIPFPAMSNAVPWSGEVRTNGNPIVIFTARSNSSVLSAIKP